MEKEAVEKLVDNAIKKHCEYDDEKHAEILKKIEENHDQSKIFFEKATPVIEAFNNATTSGTVLYKVIMIAAKVVIALGAIIGVFVAFKEWVKR